MSASSTRPDRGGDRDRDVAGGGASTRTSSSRGTRDRGVLDDRLGERGPARLLEQEHEVEVVATEPPWASGASTPSTPISPSRATAPERPVVVRPRVAHDLGGHSFVEEVAHGVAEASWSSVKAKRIVIYRRGSPSTRSATTLRWISLVPA